MMPNKILGPLVSGISIKCMPYSDTFMTCVVRNSYLLRTFHNKCKTKLRISDLYRFLEDKCITCYTFIFVQRKQTFIWIPVVLFWRPMTCVCSPAHLWKTFERQMGYCLEMFETVCTCIKFSLETEWGSILFVLSKGQIGTIFMCLVRQTLQVIVDPEI